MSDPAAVAELGLARTLRDFTCSFTVTISSMDLKSGRGRARIAWALVLVFVLVLATVGLAAWHSTVQRPRAFIRRWSERFRDLGSAEGARRLSEEAPVYFRAFESGEWFVAACEHSCCSGAGFDVTVIRDSLGAIYVDTQHTFCGIEGMSRELGQISGDSLSSFYSHAGQLTLRRR